MKTGDLRERLSIQTRSDAESGTYATNITYNTIAIVNCKAVNIAGKEIISSRGARFNADYRFTIRWYQGLTKEHMILYRDHMSGLDVRMEIISIQNADEQRRYMHVYARIEAESTADTNPSPAAVPYIP